MRFFQYYLLFVLFVSQPVRADFVSVIAEIGSFLQSGTITNLSDAGWNIRSITLDLGLPAVDIATFDTNGGTTLSGGTPQNFFANNRWFQTLQFNGLSIAPGQQFLYSNLDLDVIRRLSPPTVAGPAGAIRNASLSVDFDRGLLLNMRFSDLPAEIPQRLTASAQVPAPATGILLMSVLLIGYWVYQRRNKFAVN